MCSGHFRTFEGRALLNIETLFYVPVLFDEDIVYRQKAVFAFLESVYQEMFRYDTSERPVRHSETAPFTENASVSPAEEQGYQGVSPMWDPLLTHQLRVLLYTDRLLSLQYRDDHRSPEYQHYSSQQPVLAMHLSPIKRAGKVDFSRILRLATCISIRWGVR